ncbi:MAG: hypothetical protein QM490_06315 [Candidatus Gracilibacteria bacterium]
MVDLKLTEKQIKIMKGLGDKINDSKLGNEDKIYIGYFIEALLDENYAGASNIGFVFLEKYLRTKLIFIRHSKSGKSASEFLQSLDYEESLLENGEDGGNDIKNVRGRILFGLNQYKIDGKITEKTIIKDVKEYIDLVDKNGIMPKNQFSFNNICNDLKKEGKFDNKKSRSLTKLYSKYRNPLHHGLFKKLIDQEAETKKVPVVHGGIPGEEIKMIEVDSSNLILREMGIIQEVLKGVSIIMFNEISELLELFEDIE